MVIRDANHRCHLAHERYSISKPLFSFNVQNNLQLLAVLSLCIEFNKIIIMGLKCQLQKDIMFNNNGIKCQHIVCGVFTCTLEIVVNIYEDVF